MRNSGIFRVLKAPERASTTGSGAALLLGLTLALTGCTGVDGSRSKQVKMTSFAPLVQDVIPAVVNVSAVQKPAKAAADSDVFGGVDPVKDSKANALPLSTLDQLLRKFFEEQERKGGPNLRGLALGSGFIIDPRGYIVTDNHVVENSDGVTVTFHDGTQHKAEIVGRDPLTDLALLKIDTMRPLPYVDWGDSDAARVGDWVLAIGNPFGLDDTVSTGIISARGRDIHSGPYDDFLQIDAAINRGNSGGPTFDLDGKVIGINSAIYSPNGGSVGIGFAIPANLARPVVQQLLQHGKVERGWLGVQIQPVTAEIAQGFGLPRPEGALVAGVSPAGPAARAGLAQGDVILAVNGHPVERMRDLPFIVAEMPAGHAVDVTVWRRGQRMSLRPVVGAMPADPEIAALDLPQSVPPDLASADIATGITLVPLTAQLHRELKVPENVRGAVVRGVTENSPLATADLLPGDVIEMINQEPVASPKDAVAKLRAAAARAKTLLLLVNRHGNNRYLALSLANRTMRGGPG
jgi:serine protease Do